MKKELLLAYSVAVSTTGLVSSILMLSMIKIESVLSLQGLSSIANALSISLLMNYISSLGLNSYLSETFYIKRKINKDLRKIGLPLNVYYGPTSYLLVVNLIPLINFITLTYTVQKINNSLNSIVFALNLQERYRFQEYALIYLTAVISSFILPFISPMFFLIMWRKLSYIESLLSVIEQKLEEMKRMESQVPK